MRYGVIDLGSNTIRTVVYETEGKSFKKLISERSFTGILNYIENGRLRPDGHRGNPRGSLPNGRALPPARLRGDSRLCDGIATRGTERRSGLRSALGHRNFRSCPHR